MGRTSFHGNKAGIFAVALLAISLCSVFAAFRLKKSAEIRLWEKSLVSYSAQLEAENQAAIKKEMLR